MATARRATVEEVEDEEAPHIVLPSAKAKVTVDVSTSQEPMCTPPTYNSEFLCTVNTPLTSNTFVSRTFENHSPAKTITFVDSGASDHFFRDRSEFRN
jgi:hypothetical protein